MPRIHVLQLGFFCWACFLRKKADPLPVSRAPETVYWILLPLPTPLRVISTAFFLPACSFTLIHSQDAANCQIRCFPSCTLPRLLQSLFSEARSIPGAPPRHCLYDRLRRRQRLRGHLQSRHRRNRSRGPHHGHHPPGHALFYRRGRSLPVRSHPVLS